MCVFVLGTKMTGIRAFRMDNLSWHEYVTFVGWMKLILFDLPPVRIHYASI